MVTALNSCLAGRVRRAFPSALPMIPGIRRAACETARCPSDILRVISGQFPNRAKPVRATRWLRLRVSIAYLRVDDGSGVNRRPLKATRAPQLRKKAAHTSTLSEAE